MTRCSAALRYGRTPRRCVGQTGTHAHYQRSVRREDMASELSGGAPFSSASFTKMCVLQQLQAEDLQMNNCFLKM